MAAGFPPALLEEVLQREELGSCGDLRRLASGMDVLPPDLVGRFYDRLPECGLFNCYGPTEATVYVLEHRCRREEPVLREIAPGHWAACHYAETSRPPG